MDPNRLDMGERLRVPEKYACGGTETQVSTAFLGASGTFLPFRLTLLPTQAAVSQAEGDS